LAARAARDGNPSSASDAGVAGACAMAAAEGASLNVRINLPSLTDEKVATEIEASRRRLHDLALERATEVRRLMDDLV